MTRARVGAWPALAAALTLAACLPGLGEQPAVTGPAPASPPAAATGPAPPPIPATAPRPKPPQPPQGAHASQPQQAPAQPSPPAGALDLAGLLGVTPDTATSRLGLPAATRDETPARVMTWRVGACTLDLFFYMDMASRAFRALAWELRPDTDQASAASTCPGPSRGPA